MSENYNWYIGADTSRFAGKWIAIARKKVVASGNDARDVYEKAKKEHPNEKLSLAKVPTEDTLIL